MGNSFSTVAIEANIKSASRPKRMIPNIIGIWQDSPAQVEICPSSNPSGMILYTAFNSLQPAAGGDRVLHSDDKLPRVLSISYICKQYNYWN